jgi:hypothetical protein
MCNVSSESATSTLATLAAVADGSAETSLLWHLATVALWIETPSPVAKDALESIELEVARLERRHGVDTDTEDPDNEYREAGALGVQKALATFDPARGSWRTHCRKEVRRALAKYARTLPVRQGGSENLGVSASARD